MSDQTIEQRLDEMLPCINCGNQADSADGFGICTCGNEKRRQDTLQLLNKTKIDEGRLTLEWVLNQLSFDGSEQDVEYINDRIAQLKEKSN